MSDDSNVTYLPGPAQKRETATCAGHVPSENPDAPHLRLDGLRRPSGKPDTLPADLAPMGLDSRSWPFTEGSTRIGRKTLRELRDWADNAKVTTAETENAILQAAAFLERADRKSTRL